MALNTLKCNHLTPLGLKGLIRSVETLNIRWRSLCSPQTRLCEQMYMYCFPVNSKHAAQVWTASASVPTRDGNQLVWKGTLSCCSFAAEINVFSIEKDGFIKSVLAVVTGTWPVHCRERRAGKCAKCYFGRVLAQCFSKPNNAPHFVTEEIALHLISIYSKTVAQFSGKHKHGK